MQYVGLTGDTTIQLGVSLYDANLSLTKSLADDLTIIIIIDRPIIVPIHVLQK